MPQSLKKETNLILYVIAVTIIITSIGFPLRYILDLLRGSSFENYLISRIISRALVIIVAAIFIIKFALKRINGFNNKVRFTNLQATIFPILICTLVLWLNISEYRKVSWETLNLSIISALLVGFAEEITMRGIILPLMIRKSGKLVWSALFSSIIFGLLHYLNLFRYPGQIDWVNGQVLFAICMGIFFSGLFLRTGNILIPAIIHGFFNFSFGGKLNLNENALDPLNNIQQNTDGSSMITALIIHAFITVSGLLMIKWSDRKRILNEVGRNDYQY